jgi:hypothetical protein
VKVTFEYGVDFVRLPTDPPTIGNCSKCAFFGAWGEWGKLDRCIRSDCRVCNYGRAGYFVKNYMREVPDIINNAQIEEEAHGTSKAL